MDRNDPEIPFHEGNALAALKRPEAALAAFANALEQRPDHVEALCNRGNALQALGRFAEAVDHYDAAIVLQPDNAAAWANRGNALQGAGRLQDALVSYDEALRRHPDDARAQSGRGVALQRLGRLDEALAAFDVALGIDPGFTEGWVNRGKALHESGELDGAVLAYEVALRLDPADGDAVFNLALALLARGDFSAGWAAYEARWRSKHRPETIAGADWPLWTDEPLDGLALLVTAEQGHGDLIQFARFLPRLAAAGATVTLLAPARMHRLLAGLAETCSLIATIPAIARFDRQIPLMSLPGRLGLGAADFAASPYLRPEPTLVRQWERWLGPAGLRIGIVWQGNPAYAGDHRRSIPLACFSALARLPGVRLVSLQRHHGLDQTRDLPDGMSLQDPGPTFDAGPDAFIDAAALIEALDLIVTSDTAIAHLAGALGRPVWLALPRVPDWRWGHHGATSPWYPTMRLYRQSRDGDWDGVVAAIAADASRLPARAGAADLITVPISVGELLDKLAILEIKRARIADPAKRESVVRELSLLDETRQTHLTGETAAGLERELKRINETLWDLEDDIRLCEQAGDFGARFTAIARAIYKTNDRRAQVKRLINAHYGSPLVEVKSYAE